MIQLSYSFIRRNNVSVLIALLSFTGLAGLVVYGPMAQEPSYHQFADQRILFNLPNFWNVLTNLPFVMVGMIGLYRSGTMKTCIVAEEMKVEYTCFFVGILFTGITSANYHLWPGNGTLFWDRLAMAISFMAFLSIVIGAFINNTLGKKLLIPLILFGQFSVVYWLATEQYGVGDLRLYIITQFLTPFVIAIIILSRPADSISISDILIIGGGYGLAKLFEAFDVQIYQFMMLSGHSLKHMAAAFSAYWVWRIFERNQNTCRPVVMNMSTLRRQL